MLNPIKSGLFAALLASAASTVAAQDVTLRVHHFMPAPAPLHANFLVPWAEQVAEASGGRIEVQLYEAMSLGGGPPDLYGQAVDGAVDIVLTLPGYTPGVFDEIEVFELPFMMSDPIATSAAMYDLIDTRLQDAEFQDTKVLAAWEVARGLCMTPPELVTDGCVFTVSGE